jgi:ADP-heptose:LPS heptosyltransferase
LKQAWPGAHVTWVAGKGRTVYARELAPLVAGAVDEIIENAGLGSHAAELLHRPLGHRRFDLVIDTQRRVFTSLILRRLRTHVFVSGAARFLLSDRRPPRGYERPKRLLDQLFDLIAIAGGAAVTPSFDLTLGSPWREAALTALPPGPTYVGIAPGAGGAHKRWPRDRFVALAEAQIRAGRAVAMLLGPAERDWHAALHALLPSALFPLQDPRIAPEVSASPLYTIALGQRLAAAVANDSGAGHLLAAAGSPLVSLFGPTSAAKFAPAARRLEVVAAQRFGDEAIDAIPVAAVIDAVDRELEPPPR